MSKLLEIKHLKKYYGNSRGVEDVSIRLDKGDIYGFIGPNGAGKSTTIRTILGLLNKNNGMVYIDDKEFDRNDISIKKKIGYLPSEIHLYDDMTVKEMLDYHEGFYDKNVNKKRAKLSKLLKLDENKKINELSLGNMKKVGIVLALMHDPEIIILDEATSGLDPIMQNILHDILLEEKKNGKAILYSSHILSEISSLCDTIGFIKDGVIIKEDNVENINKDNYTYLTITSNDIESIKKELNLEIKEEKNNTVRFINNLDSNMVIKKLSKYNIEKILIEEISLEDLFVNYYK